MPSENHPSQSGAAAPEALRDLLVEMNDLKRVRSAGRTGSIAERIGASPLVVALVALAVFLGHLYPVFLGFKGGKGVATALGVLLAIEPWLGVATALTWLIIAVFMRYSSLAAIVAAVFAPCFYLLGGALVWQAHRPVAVAIVAIALTLVYRHRANIGRLLKGTEPRIGKKKA